MSTRFVYEYEGYKGTAAIASAFGIPVGTLKSRLRSGKSIREAVRFGDGRENNSGSAVYEWNGIKGLANIAKAIGSSHVTLYQHIKDGCTINEAVQRVAKSKASAALVRELRAKARQKSKAKPVEFIGIKEPTDLSPLWRLALGVMA